jgi:hypothetical protein
MSPIITGSLGIVVQGGTTMKTETGQLTTRYSTGRRNAPNSESVQDFADADSNDGCAGNGHLWDSTIFPRIRVANCHDA